MPFPSPEDLSHPGFELGSPTLQADSLPSEPPGKSPTSKSQGAPTIARKPPEMRGEPGADSAHSPPEELTLQSLDLDL